MPIQVLSALHESASLRGVTGSLLRPGGFLLTERGISYCRFSTEALILDVGCGTGASVDYLRRQYHFKAVGFDRSEDMLWRNSQAGYLPLVQANAVDLPVSAGVCDGILCECVISLVPEPRRALSEFVRVLRSGGYLVMSDLYDRCQERAQRTHVAECMSPFRARTVIESLVLEAGFDLLVWEDHTRYLKELAAQLVLSQDSPDDFCKLFAVSGSGCSGSYPVSSPRPGYFLMVAQKR
jgi:SAM-dependent methyltransferase